MNIRIICGMALAVFAAQIVSAQDPQAFLKVTRRTSGRQADTTWQTSYGSNSRDFTRTLTLSVFVKGMGKTAPATLEWYFIAKDLESKTSYVFDSGMSDITLDSAKPTEIDITSKELASSVQNYVALGEKVQSGSKIDGYIVRVVAGDKVLTVDASSRQLEITGKNPAKMSQLVSSSGSNL